MKGKSIAIQTGREIEAGEINLQRLISAYCSDRKDQLKLYHLKILRLLGSRWYVYTFLLPTLYEIHGLCSFVVVWFVFFTALELLKT